MTFRSGSVSLSKISSIYTAEAALEKEAGILQQLLATIGHNTIISHSTSGLFYNIYLEKRRSLEEEEYALMINDTGITIRASNPHGFINAFQTLRQLIDPQQRIPFCEISDKPAYSIRGYMVDVGRNYLSIPLIKQQLDIMAQYKLNVFHMHLTEDIAWRIQSNRYPALHAAENMLRNKGKYYTFAELNELIGYCKERGIAFIPEIDMPGHSDAFTRATGYDMQSPEGKKILHELLDEFFANVPTEYFHIGGDEVTYREKNFLKEISAYIRSKGKKILAWEPGGETDTDVIKQLWIGTRKPPIDAPSIDSRHLYVNHFDPLEGVVAVFNHSLLDTTHGDQRRLGAILCNWPDRRVTKEEDVITMNAVYPSMIAFAERAWNGGGYQVMDASMQQPGSPRYEAFRVFEKKLLAHKRKYFQGLPFPYQQQSDIQWTLIGPFDNKGNVFTTFPVEQKAYRDTMHTHTYPTAWGGTIWLRHFWDPMIASHFQKLNDSSTWYAWRKIYADSAGYYPFWIGFDNISRNQKAPTPAAGTWDNRGSKVWVNQQEVQPPQWKYAGRFPQDLEEPLVDESYEYREPTMIYLKKGWNEVLLKVPVASFKSPNEIPVKWMFTFVQVRE